MADLPLQMTALKSRKAHFATSRHDMRESLMRRSSVHPSSFRIIQSASEMTIDEWRIFYLGETDGML